MPKPDIWTDTDDDPRLCQLRHYNDDVSTLPDTTDWADLCLWASTSVGGRWCPTRDGLVWRLGSRSWWITSSASLPTIREARAVAGGLGCDCGWSIGSAATSILKSVGKPDPPASDRLRLKHDDEYGYIHAIPGEYGHCQHYDVSAYYFTLLSKLPSIRPLILHGGRILWQPWPVGEEHRWRHILASIEDNKPIRNAIVGCMVGREARREYYYQGKQFWAKGGPGPFTNAGNLIVRSGWELTRRAAIETEAPWAHTDAVIARGGLYPSCWADLGFRIRLEGDGQAEVCNAIVYRCGLKMTRFYDQGSRYLQSTPPPPPPPIEFHRQWLIPGP